MLPYLSRARLQLKARSPISEASVFGLRSCTARPSPRAAHSDASLRSSDRDMASAMAAWSRAIALDPNSSKSIPSSSRISENDDASKDDAFAHGAVVSCICRVLLFSLLLSQCKDRRTLPGFAAPIPRPGQSLSSKSEGLTPSTPKNFTPWRACNQLTKLAKA